MKILNRLCITLIVLMSVLVLQSRDGYGEDTVSNSDIELLRADIRTQKAALIADRMHFTNEEADAFWPIYRKYEVELAAVNDRKISLLKNYVNHYDTMNDDQTKQMAEGVLEVDQATVDLRKRFFGEVEKALTAKTAARWLQLERRLQLYLDAKLAKDVPTLKR